MDALTLHDFRLLTKWTSDHIKAEAARYEAMTRGVQA